MSKATIPERPEPDGYLTIRMIGREVEVNAYRDSTLDAYAEAYADARVREALEWASNMCDERAMSYERVAESYDGDPEDISELRSQAWVISNIGIGIRALIPPTE